MRANKFYIVMAIGSFVTGFMAGMLMGRSRGVPFVERSTTFSIGIYGGESHLGLLPHKKACNPVLTHKDVTDVKASLVADPFMVRDGARWYMFFEVFNRKSNQGDIGLATSKDGLKWSYEKIVIDEAFHLSYPYVFKWKKTFFMIPETEEAGAIRLYKSIEFPYKWGFVKNLVYGKYVDTSLFRYNCKWWMLTGSGMNETLNLFYADEIEGPWKKHPMSPVVKENPNMARPGGRVLVMGNQIIRFAQDDYPRYGNEVRAFEIYELTEEDYKEREASKKAILGGTGVGWNSKGMHHIDLHMIEKGKWLACVDGEGGEVLFFGHRY